MRNQMRTFSVCRTAEMITAPCLGHAAFHPVHCAGISAAHSAHRPRPTRREGRKNDATRMESGNSDLPATGWQRSTARPSAHLVPQKLRTVSDGRRWSHRRSSTPRERERSHTQNSGQFHRPQKGQVHSRSNRRACRPMGDSVRRGTILIFRPRHGYLAVSPPRCAARNASRRV